jgi:uncharacterized protein (DUF924 family)
MDDHEAEEVLGFWFGAPDAQGRADKAHAARWWRKDPAFDAEVRTRFGALHEAVMRSGREVWLSSPRGRLAYVIVLDQLSRNMFRDSARAFAGDARALDAALAGLAAGDDQALGPDERSFLYMPLVHSERLDLQERAVALFAGEPGTQKFAEQHRDIIRRFGRFPHRNALLGRPSTPDELAFLKQPGSSF